MKYPSDGVPHAMQRIEREKEKVKETEQHSIGYVRHYVQAALIEKILFTLRCPKPNNRHCMRTFLPLTLLHSNGVVSSFFLILCMLILYHATLDEISQRRSAVCHAKNRGEKKKVREKEQH